MDGYRESDSFIVPRKPSNKGCSQGPAEEVEGRELAKGNAAEHSRDRTQRRVTPVTRARPRTASPVGCLPVRPEAGARCGNAARRDLVRRESCTHDGGRPSEAARQVEASNRRMRLWSRAMVVSDTERRSDTALGGG